MIYKGHDIRIERDHIRVKDLRSGVEWTEDTITKAKHEIDELAEIRDSLTRNIKENSSL